MDAFRISYAHTGKLGTRADFQTLIARRLVACRYAYTITCTGFKKDASGKVVELTAEADLNPAGKKPPKGVLNWVAQPTPGQEPLKMEVHSNNSGRGLGGTGDSWIRE